MKNICKSIILIVGLGLTGCAIKHDYSWSEYQLAPGRVFPKADGFSGQELSLPKGGSDDSKIFLGSIPPHQYYGSEQMLADGIIMQLGEELEKLSAKINDSAAKSLRITVTHTGFERGMWKIAATLNFSVEFGAGGRVKTYSVRNSSPGSVPRTFNGAVALAVLEIINDGDVRAYIEN